jgi:hypothetical protein
VHVSHLNKALSVSASLSSRWLQLGMFASFLTWILPEIRQEMGRQRAGATGATTDASARR